MQYTRRYAHDAIGLTRTGAYQSVVGFEGGSAIRQLIDGALRDAGVEMNVVMELRSIAAILQLVATTRSLGFVSELGVRSGDHRLSAIPVRGLRIVRKLAVDSGC